MFFIYLGSAGLCGALMYTTFVETKNSSKLIGKLFSGFLFLLFLTGVVVLLNFSLREVGYGVF